MLAFQQTNVMFVCCSFTARKGLNILIYWIIVRVLSSSRPYQALTDIPNKSKQANPDQRQNFHFHLSHLVPSNSAENWYLGQPHQSTAHKLLKIWQNSNENFHFHLNNLLLVQLTASAHKLIENWMICVKINMCSLMWFIRLSSVSMIFSHLSHEKYLWSALCVNNH